VQASELIQNIELPPRDLKKLRFCESAKLARVDEWLGHLRATQAMQTSAALYEALPEVTRLNCNPHTRFDMLEHMRPYAQNCIEALSKLFLNQPICLPEEAQKAAIVAQSLQKSMIQGYVSVIADVIEDKRQKHVREEFFGVALHRAITGYSLLFLRSYQIYSQTPKGMWLALHSLFQIADQYDLLDTGIKDPIIQKPSLTSIQTVYMRSVLMSTARVSQLKQKDIAALYRAFCEWSSMVRFQLGTSDAKESFYCINLSRDAAPFYKSRLNQDEDSDLIIELDFAPLLSQLTKQTRDAVQELSGTTTVVVSKEVSIAALRHVIDTLGNTALRMQERRNIQSAADICVGLADCHYFLCDNQTFEQFVSSQNNRGGVEDTFLSGLTPRDSFGDERDERPHHRISIQNVSQGGYCLFWEGHAIKVESGDIIGLKEFGKKFWSIGIVRGIRQKRNGSQLGVQILSEKTQAAAIAQSYDMGGYSDYMRALYLPASRLLDIPASLITASIPFQELDKVKLMADGLRGTAKLDQRILSVGSIQQFSFHTLDDQGGETSSKQSSGDW
jgi:hypothetical protein